MKNITSLLFVIIFFPATLLAQETDSVVQDIIIEANDNSKLEILAHELMDVVGPRLVGTPEMQKANDWAVSKYSSWGINAENQQWGRMAWLAKGNNSY